MKNIISCLYYCLLILVFISLLIHVVRDRHVARPPEEPGRPPRPGFRCGDGGLLSPAFSPLGNVRNHRLLLIKEIKFTENSINNNYSNRILIIDE